MNLHKCAPCLPVFPPHSLPKAQRLWLDLMLRPGPGCGWKWKPVRGCSKEYQSAYANDHRISFMPAAFSTSGRIDAEFLRLLFYHAHRESEEFFRLTGQLAQPNQDYVFSKRAAFFNSLVFTPDAFYVKMNGPAAGPLALQRGQSPTDTPVARSSSQITYMHNGHTHWWPHMVNTQVARSDRHTEHSPRFSASCFAFSKAAFSAFSAAHSFWYSCPATKNSFASAISFL